MVPAAGAVVYRGCQAMAMRRRQGRAAHLALARPLRAQCVVLGCVLPHEHRVASRRGMRLHVPNGRVDSRRRQVRFPPLFRLAARRGLAEIDGARVDGYGRLLGTWWDRQHVAQCDLSALHVRLDVPRRALVEAVDLRDVIAVRIHVRDAPPACDARSVRGEPAAVGCMLVGSAVGRTAGQERQSGSQSNSVPRICH